MGTGGTRYGAGRPAWKAKAEHCRSVDVRRFAAENMLRDGAWTWQWCDPDTGDVRSSITVYGRSDRITLAFSIEGTPLRTELPILRTACNYGGSRPWFACPCCGRRVALVFCALAASPAVIASVSVTRASPRTPSAEAGFSSASWRPS